jgi:predicted ArsR family transcriptional regulator
MDEVESIAHGVARRMAADAPQPVPGETFTDRLRRVVEFLNKQGYVARWESNGHGYLLHTANCPYQGLTQHHAAPCVMDMALISDLLETVPQRVSWLSAGDDTCSYLVHEPERLGQTQ